jgi:hypothetical protein
LGGLPFIATSIFEGNESAIQLIRKKSVGPDPKKRRVPNVCNGKLLLDEKACKKLSSTDLHTGEFVMKNEPWRCQYVSMHSSFFTPSRTLRS